MIVLVWISIFVCWNRILIDRYDYIALQLPYPHYVTEHWNFCRIRIWDFYDSDRCNGWNIIRQILKGEGGHDVSWGTSAWIENWREKRSRVLQEGMGVWDDFEVEEFSKKENFAPASFAPKHTACNLSKTYFLQLKPWVMRSVCDRMSYGLSFGETILVEFGTLT